LLVEKSSFNAFLMKEKNFTGMLTSIVFNLL